MAARQGQGGGPADGRDEWQVGRDEGADSRPADEWGQVSGQTRDFSVIIMLPRASGSKGVWGRREFAGTKESIARIQRCSHPGCSGQLDVIQPSCVDGWCGILQWACREGEEDADE